jgi:hypothetical protein
MKVGDVVKLPRGCSSHWGLPTGTSRSGGEDSQNRQS